MKKRFGLELLAHAACCAGALSFAVIAHGQDWKLIGISGQQGTDERNEQGEFVHPDHTLFEINTANGEVTELFTLPWVNDSMAIGFNPVDGLLYRTAGAAAYSNNPLRTGHDQGGPDIAGVGYQDSQYMDKINLQTEAITAVFNAAPCPNPDPALPCFGLTAPRPDWILPEERRNSTQTDESFRQTGEHEYHAVRGLAWSAAENLFYISDEDGIYKLTPDGQSTFLNRPAFSVDAQNDEAKAIAF